MKIASAAPDTTLAQVRERVHAQQRARGDVGDVILDFLQPNVLEGSAATTQQALVENSADSRSMVDTKPRRNPWK